MIINIRGANGAGKTTVVRRVMESYSVSTPKFVDGRNRPIGYVCDGPDRHAGAHLQRLFVPGSYENPTGGCDTIREIETIFDLVRTYADAGMSVLFEGIIAQHSKTRLNDLWRAHRDLVVIVLDTSREACVQAVRDRRVAKGDDRPLDPSNVEKEYRGVHSGKNALRSLGMRVEELDRENAVARCVELLRGPITATADPASLIIPDEIREADDDCSRVGRMYGADRDYSGEPPTGE